jgi:hypothetical protein
MTDTVFNVEETLIINKLKSAVKDAMNANGIGTYSNINMIIAGGFFTSFFERKDYKDLDVFILNSAGLFENCVVNTGNVPWKFRENDGTSHYFKNPHILKTATNDRNRVQFILTDYETREELIAGFDFVHCTISYSPLVDKLFITRRAYDANENKRLINNSKTEPVPTWRLQKFLDRGWSTVEAKTT